MWDTFGLWVLGQAETWPILAMWDTFGLWVFCEAEMWSILDGAQEEEEEEGRGCDGVLGLMGAPRVWNRTFECWVEIAPKQELDKKHKKEEPLHSLDSLLV